MPNLPRWAARGKSWSRTTDGVTRDYTPCEVKLGLVRMQELARAREFENPASHAEAYVYGSAWSRADVRHFPVGIGIWVVH